MRGSVEDVPRDQFYLNFLRGLEVREINWLLGDDPQNLLFVYGHGTRSVERATFYVPWPVLFLLGFDIRNIAISAVRCLVLRLSCAMSARPSTR